MKPHHIDYVAQSIYKATSTEGWNGLDEQEKNRYRTMASKAVAAYISAVGEDSGTEKTKAKEQSEEQKLKIIEWIENHSLSYIRTRLGISTNQANGIKMLSKSHLDQFNDLLTWAIESESVVIQKELAALESLCGRSRAQTALWLGMTLEKYKKASTGHPVDAITARYIKNKIL